MNPGRVILACLLPALWAMAAPPEEEPVPLNINVPFKTLGGKQLWGDEHICGGWRIQQNVISGHHRLLDPKNVRRAWGSFEQCESVLGEARKGGEAVLTSRRLCILLHGYLRTKGSMDTLRKGLEAKGYQVYAVGYPSTQFDIGAYAAQVVRLIRRLEGDFDEINLVTHSLGGLVARRVLSKNSFEHIGRLVMLGPPNQGAVMADLLLSWWPSEFVGGPTGKQLVTGVEGFARQAGTPPCEFGVIAGSRGDGKGWNPLIPGDDDGVVGVENTRLEGMADFCTVRVAHTFIMDDPGTLEYVVRFLESGRFGDTASGDECSEGP